MENKQEYLHQIYALARSKGLCHTQGEFAALLDVNMSNLSRAFKGDKKYLTDSFIAKLQKWAEQMQAKQEPQPQQDIVIPAATATFYENLSEAMKNMSETIRLQQELISQLQGAHIQKKIG